MPSDAAPVADPVTAAPGLVGGGAPATASSTPGRHAARPLLAAGTTLGILALWELLARTGVIPAEVSPPSRVVRWLGTQAQTSVFWDSVRSTMWQWAIGLVVSAGGGVIIGVAIGVVPLARRLLQVTFELLRPVPSVIYLPVLILLWGGTPKTGVVLVVAATIWPMLFQASYGAMSVDRLLLETAKLFGLTQWQRLTRITLPSILPYLATGLRISSSLALIVAVAVELLGGIPGLGSDLAKDSANGLYDGMYGVIVVSGVLGVVLNTLFERAERRLLRWHVSHRSVG